MVRFPIERKFDPQSYILNPPSSILHLPSSDLRLLLFCLNFADNFKTILLCLTVRYYH